MKNRPNELLSVLAIAAVGFVVVCAAYAKGKGGVEMGERYAIIYPEANLSGAHCDELNKVLQKYDTSLYRIQTYKDGKFVETKGNLAENALRRGLASEVTRKAQSMHFTGCAIQAGSMRVSKKAGAEEPTPSPSPGGSTTLQTMIPKIQRIVDKVQPTLDKYNKK